MVFSSTIFLFLFFPIVLIAYYNPFIKSRYFRNTFLVIASILFYAWGEPVFVFLMLSSILFTWIIGLKLEDGKKIWLVVGVSYHVLILFVFKYWAFSIRNLNLILHREYTFIELSLPIGISFFTFQMLSYLFDVYYHKAGVQKNLLNLSLYVSLFPQLIAGPIVRYASIETEIQNRKESAADIVWGMQRFIYGLGKKVLVANYVATIADNCFDNMNGNMTALSAWMGAVCYTLQIYYDFSGYSDMAIGLGRIFGFHFDENFKYPYISGSVTEFWRRWHISLSSWFRDYVYIPLGGNRVSKNRWIMNLCIVWFLTGLWHGANWTFICWGLFYFLILAVEKMWGGWAPKYKNIGHIYTMLVIIVAWVIFRSNSMYEAKVYLENMFCIHQGTMALEISTKQLIILALAILGSTPIVGNIINDVRDSRYYWIESGYMLGVFLLSLLQIIGSTYNPFIYFNF